MPPNQTLEGEILVDSISSLEMNLKESSFTGSIQGEGNVSVSLDATSTWTLTDDTYVSSFEGDTANVNSNGYTRHRSECADGCPWR